MTDWRRQMIAGGIKTPVPLDELENHLREEIEWQKKTGQGEAEAFATAVRKIGPAHAVKKEFEKIGTTRKSLNWKRFEFLFLVYAALYPLLVGSLACIFKNGSFSEMTAGQQFSSLAAAVAFSSLAWGMQWGCGKFPTIRTNRIRNAIFVPVMIWLVTFAYLIMPHTGLDESQRAVVSLWGFAPFGIVLGWIWGFATAARKTMASAGA
ncbi:MAG TPA: hypothetical protein VNN22_01820 [Verrucomicrobiae bacterium]|nr:hypothetical protein [Verrucomicrobiae bacterium]